MRATRRARSRPRADKRPSRSRRPSSCRAPVLRGAACSSCRGGSSALQRTPRDFLGKPPSGLGYPGGDHGRRLTAATVGVDEPVGRARAPSRASTSGRRTLMRRSKRSSSGPDMRATYRARAMSVQRQDPGEPSAPQRQAFMAATSMKRAGKGHRCARPADDHSALLERLAQVVEHVPGELRQLVQEQHPAMGAADLTRPEPGAAAADQRHGRSAVVRRPKGGPDRKAVPEQLQTSGRVDLRHFEGICLGKRRQYTGQTPGQHGFACAGRAHHQEVVPASGGDFQGLAPERLTADLCQIWRRGLVLRAGRGWEVGPAEIWSSAPRPVLSGSGRLSQLTVRRNWLRGRRRVPPQRWLGPPPPRGAKCPRPGAGTRRGRARR